MKVKMIGIHWKILAWIGSGGCGFSFCWRNIVTPMISAQAGMCR